MVHVACEAPEGHTLRKGVQERRQAVIALAEQLHRWRCHIDHTDDGNLCTWEFETWDALNGTNLDQYGCNAQSRREYFDKADRLLGHLGNLDEARKFVLTLAAVSPQLALDLIERL
jgi:hypothetical protein